MTITMTRKELKDKTTVNILLAAGYTLTLKGKR
jgi:hypothetical protein